MPVTAMIALILLVPPAKPLEPVGLLTVHGNVTVKRANRKAVAIAHRCVVLVGDVIHVGGGASANLLIRASHRVYTFAPAATARVRATDIALLAGPAPQIKSFPLDAPDPTRDRRMAMSSELRGGSGPDVSLIGGVRQGPIELHWIPSAAATSVTLQLFTLDGKPLKRFAIDVGSASFKVPSEVVTDGNWYRARLTMSFDSPVPQSGETLFRTLTEEERRHLAAGEAKLAAQKARLGADYDWARAEMLTSYSLVGEMLEAWKAGLTPLKLRENSAAAQWMLGEWYEVAGFPHEALNAYERAKENGGGDEDLDDAIQRLTSSSEIEGSRL